MGAISLKNTGGEKYAVVASDRMVTLSLPSVEWEQNVPKTIKVADNCVVSTAGSAIAFTNILRLAQPEIDKLVMPRKIPEIVEIIRKCYEDVIKDKLEEDILAKIGLSLQEFYEGNQTISPQIINLTVDAMAKYNYNLVILVAGVDDHGPHVYRIDNPGKVDPFDAIGYCAIGSGDIHAVSAFIANDYDPNLDLNHIAAMTYEAKKRSEKAQGVGEESDLYIICNNRVVKIADEVIQKLDKIYLKREEQEKKAVADIQSEIAKLDMEKIEKEG